MAFGPPSRLARASRRAVDDSASTIEAAAEPSHLPEPFLATDSWPDTVPVFQDEVETVDVFLGKLIDEIIKDCQNTRTEMTLISSVTTMPP